MIDNPLYVLAAALVLVGASARLTRLIVDDTWPPTEWVKFQYLRRVNEAWAPLVTCAFCLAPWFTLLLGAWGWASSWHWAWWAVCGWLTASYAAAMVVVRDTPGD